MPEGHPVGLSPQPLHWIRFCLDHHLVPYCKIWQSLALTVGRFDAADHTLSLSWHQDTISLVSHLLLLFISQASSHWRAQSSNPFYHLPCPLRWSQADTQLINALHNDSPPIYSPSSGLSPELLSTCLLALFSWVPARRLNIVPKSELLTFPLNLLLPLSSSLPFLQLLRQNLGVIPKSVLSDPISDQSAILVFSAFKTDQESTKHFSYSPLQLLPVLPGLFQQLPRLSAGSTISPKCKLHHVTPPVVSCLPLSKIPNAYHDLWSSSNRVTLTTASLTSNPTPLSANLCSATLVSLLFQKCLCSFCCLCLEWPSPRWSHGLFLSFPHVPPQCHLEEQFSLTT